jgi:uncharacterized DUF497 family protein
MFREHAFGFVFKGQGHAQQHCRRTVIDSAQQLRRATPRTSHCGYDDIGVEQESHLGNDITSRAMLNGSAIAWCTFCAYNLDTMGFEWDFQKAEANFNKHGVRFSEAEPVFEDDYAITIPDDESGPDEQRFVSMGTGVKGRVLVVVYCYHGRDIRIISARPAEAHERAQYEEQR